MSTATATIPSDTTPARWPSKPPFAPGTFVKLYLAPRNTNHPLHGQRGEVLRCIYECCFDPAVNKRRRHYTKAIVRVDAVPAALAHLYPYNECAVNLEDITPLITVEAIQAAMGEDERLVDADTTGIARLVFDYQPVAFGLQTRREVLTDILEALRAVFPGVRVDGRLGALAVRAVLRDGCAGPDAHQRWNIGLRAIQTIDALRRAHWTPERVARWAANQPPYQGQDGYEYDDPCRIIVHSRMWQAEIVKLEDMPRPVEVGA